MKISGDHLPELLASRFGGDFKDQKRSERNGLLFSERFMDTLKIEPEKEFKELRIGRTIIKRKSFCVPIGNGKKNSLDKQIRKLPVLENEKKHDIRGRADGGDTLHVRISSIPLRKKIPEFHLMDRGYKFLIPGDSSSTIGFVSSDPMSFERIKMEGKIWDLDLGKGYSEIRRIGKLDFGNERELLIGEAGGFTPFFGLQEDTGLISGYIAGKSESLEDYTLGMGDYMDIIKRLRFLEESMFHFKRFSFSLLFPLLLKREDSERAIVTILKALPF